jgi:hypothetical protein
MKSLLLSALLLTAGASLFALPGCEAHEHDRISYDRGHDYDRHEYDRHDYDNHDYDHHDARYYRDDDHREAENRW